MGVPAVARTRTYGTTTLALFLGLVLGGEVLGQEPGYELGRMRRIQVTARLHAFWIDYKLPDMPAPGEIEVGI